MIYKAPKSQKESGHKTRFHLVFFILFHILISFIVILTVCRTVRICRCQIFDVCTKLPCAFFAMSVFNL